MDLPALIELGKSLGVPIGSAAAGALGAWVAFGRARSQVETSKANDTILQRAVERESENWKELHDRTRENLILSARASADAVEIRTLRSTLDARTADVQRLQRSVYALARRLADAGGLLRATDLGGGPPTANPTPFPTRSERFRVDDVAAGA